MFIFDSRLLQDKAPEGWLAWPKTPDLFLAAPAGDSMFKPWETASQGMVTAVREVALTKEYWTKLSGHFAEENHADVATQDNISCVKSIC